MVCAVTDEAKMDIQEIWLFIARDNPVAADSVEEDIYSAAERLARTPRIGHKRSDLTSEPVLFWTVRTNYLLIYRLITGGVEILRVLHAARDATELL